MNVLLKSQENIEENIKNISTHFIDENYIQNPLESKEIKLEKMQVNLMNVFDGLKFDFEKGWMNLLEKLEVDNPSIYQYFKNILNFSEDKWLELTERKEIEAQNIYKILGIAKENLNVLYSTACQLYKEERYEEARTSFLLLIVLDNLDYRHWLGEGLSLQAQQNFEQALTFLIIATTLCASLPIAHIAIAECLIQLNHSNEACAHLKLAKDSLEEDKLQKYCQDLIDQIKKRGNL